MQNSHIHDHLTVAKLAALANNDAMLVYLIEMALLYETQAIKQHKAAEPVSKVA